MQPPAGLVPLRRRLDQGQGGVEPVGDQAEVDALRDMLTGY